MIGPLARHSTGIGGVFVEVLVLMALAGIWRLVVWFHARQTREWDHAGPIDEDDGGGTESR